jgi:hypothetical protein
MSKSTTLPKEISEYFAVPESKANLMRVARSIRRGPTLRSWYSASCRRRKRFSAAIAFLRRMSRPR